VSAKRSRKEAFRPPAWVAPAVAGVVLAGFTVWAWPPRDQPQPKVRDGNRAYAQRDWPGALSQYEAAPGDGVRNAGVHMNRGLARFRAAVPPGDGGTLPELGPDATVPESWQRAQDEMRNTSRGYAGAPAEDIESTLRARASYNLANTFFAQHLWQNAIDAYKEALRLRPGLVDAAWNLELARRRKDEEDHPDAGPDASNDASQDASQDAPRDSSNDGGDSGPQGDGGNNQGDGGNNQGDGGQQPDASAPDAGAQPDGGGGSDGGNGGQPDASAPPPLSLAPLDQLERNAQDLQQMLLRRRAAQMPRSPDDER
jgi:tetratricopeptide (TPR) repeat protein